ncbi:MAG TPA: class I SAM-dependent methyltransferase [Pseudonocardia sp.]|nr:class I SAM-dependent methyltransferase [Pseudonocardia sp.]
MAAHDLTPADLDRLAADAAAEGMAELADADLDALLGLSDRLDEVALLAMAHTLGRSGLFADDASTHPVPEILAAVGVAPRHRRIVRRWLWALTREGRLHADAAGHRALRHVSAAKLEDAAADLEEAAAGLRYGPAMSRFLLSAVAYLPELLADGISLQALLFADGDVDAAEDLYRHNVGSRYINRATAALVRALADRCTGPGDLRVLEVGAGVGGTTSDVLAALAGVPLDYLFTDVSRFFLDDARARFRERSDVRFGLFDVNAEPDRHAYPPGSFDLVLAANVLHNAHHAGVALGRLHELLAPGGWLVFIDHSRDHYALMTSMEFLMSPPAGAPGSGFTDFRAGTDRIFPTRGEWLDALAGAGFGPVVALPGPDDPVARFGQFAYAGRAAGVTP